MASSIVIDIIGNDKATSAANSITSAFGKLAATLTAIAAAGATAFLVLGKQALDATAEFETLTLTMETLVARELKAADATLSMADALAQASPKAQELLEWIQKLAIESPFDQQGVADAFRTALAYGFTADEAQRLTQNLIDFTAGTGQSVAVMNNAAYALGQIRAKGKLAGQEILQLVNAGIPVNDILKEMGFTLDDVSKGLVSADEFLEAFSLTMEEDFTGAAKRGTNSWAGLINSLGDIKKIGLRTLFAETFDVLQPLVAKFAEWLQGDGLKVLEGWGKELGNITQNIVDMFSALSANDFNFAELTQAFEDWADSVDWDKVSNDLADGIASIDWAGIGEQVRLGAENIIAGFETIFSETDWSRLFQEASVAFLDFMAGLTAQDSWDTVWSTWQSNFDQLNQIIKSKGAQIAVSATLVGVAIPQNIIAALSAGTGGMLAIISGWIPQVGEILIRLKRVFFQLFSEMMQVAIKQLDSYKQQLVDKIREIINLAIAAVVPINIIVNLPNFAALAVQAAAGMALINAALSGGGGGVARNKPKPPRSGGSGGLPQAMPQAVGGSVYAGRSYKVGEQGVEEFVPDTNGRIIPNKELGSGAPPLVINLTYAPAFSTASRGELLANIRPILDDWYRQRLQS